MGYLKAFGIKPEKQRHFEEISYAVALLYNVLEASVSVYLKPFGLSTGKFNILMVIKHQGQAKGISQVDISKHLIVTPSNMTRLLAKLEREKLIQRSGQEGDRRVNIVTITAKASKLLDEIWPGYLEQLRKFSAGLGGGEQKILSGMLAKWLQGVRGK